MQYIGLVVLNIDCMGSIGWSPDIVFDAIARSCSIECRLGSIGWSSDIVKEPLKR